MIILIVGPVGSGKTTLARRIARNDRWIHICEDDLWTEIGHPPHQLRDDDGQLRVHAKAHQRIDEAVRRGCSAVLEFLVYEDPPRRLVDYQRFLDQRNIPVVTRVLRPNVETILERQRVRARPSDRDCARRRSQAEAQLRCLETASIRAEWVIDSSGETPDQTYSRHFARFVEDVSAPNVP